MNGVSQTLENPNSLRDVLEISSVHGNLKGTILDISLLALDNKDIHMICGKIQESPKKKGLYAPLIQENLLK